MSGVLSHISGLTAATNPSKHHNASNGLGHEMGCRLGKLDINDDTVQYSEDIPRAKIEALDTTWWSPPQLDEIETLINPSQPTTAPKKQRQDSRPTYTSATQSYTAKIVSPPQGRRSLSGSGSHNYPTPPVVSRGPSPPPPVVDWATAAHELSKLLVPSDRETRSCKPEDLNAEATRARRDRQSGVLLSVDGPVNDLKRMQLRDRKVKQPQYISGDEHEKPMSKANRRKTIADVSLLAQNIESPLVGDASAAQPAQRMRRRSSVTSSAGSMHAEKGSDLSLGSAAESQPGREPLAVRKARAPALPRSEIAKPKAIRKKPVSSAAPKTVSQPVETQSSHEVNKLPLSENEELKNKDVEQLVSGMTQMRIKLNVPPKEEYEARQTKTAPRGRPKSTTAKPAKAGSPTKARTKVAKNPSAAIAEEVLTPRQIPQPAPVTRPDQEMPVSALSPTLPEAWPAAQDPFQPSTPPFAASSTSPSATVPALASDIVESGPSASSSSKGVETPLTSPQPFQSSSSPDFAALVTPITAKRTRHDLPVFTSTSSISFGRPANTGQSTDPATTLESNDQKDSTLQMAGLGPEDPQPALPAQIQSAVHSDLPWTPESSAETDTKEESISADSIWDVTDTPQFRKP